MESCERCIYLVAAGDPKEPINECHRMPPEAQGKELAAYPLVKNDAPGCGEHMTAEQFMKAVEKMTEARPTASATTAKAKINAARSKALK